MAIYVFIHKLVGHIFKILPLKEEADSGKDVHLQEYIEGLARDMSGACETFPELRSSPEFIAVTNSMQYLQHNEFDRAVCKAEVFKMLGLLNRMERQLGGDNDA